MELYFNIFKVKYEKLLELLRNDKTVNINRGENVNVFINLESVFIKLINPKVIDYLKINQKTMSVEFISCIINLAAHYKWFFTKNGMHAKVYLYFPTLSNSEYKNKIHNNDYRKYYDHKFKEDVTNILVYKMISSSIPLIKTIIEYIEGVYFIDSNNIENSVVPYIINHDDSHNFIVTGSLYDVQYVNYGYKIIIPKMKDSVLLNKYNALPYIADVYECELEIPISNNFIPFILSIIGSKTRNIYNIKGVQFKSAYKLIKTALEHRIITNDSTNIKLLINAIKPAWRNIVTVNYYCTDILTQFNRLNTKDIHMIHSQISDKFDNLSLKKINDKFFSVYPILLVEITATPNK